MKERKKLKAKMRNSNHRRRQDFRCGGGRGALKHRFWGAKGDGVCGGTKPLPSNLLRLLA